MTADLGAAFTGEFLRDCMLAPAFRLLHYACCTNSMHNATDDVKVTGDAAAHKTVLLHLHWLFHHSASLQFTPSFTHQDLENEDECVFSLFV